MLYIGLYLIAIVLANLSVSFFGPASTIVNAFLFIGLDLTSRDKLHDAWHGNHLVLKMTALIAVGSILSWFLNRDAGQIALASFIAFGAAGIVDAVTYTLLGKRDHIVKVNGSNVASAAVDSFLFPAIAFGFPLLWTIMLGQFAAKVCGGAVWYIILNKRVLNEPRTTASDNHGI